MTSPITGASAGQGWVGQVPLVGVVADELPRAGPVPAGALDDQAVVGTDDEEAADASTPADLVDQDRAAVDESRLHRFAENLDDAALRGDEAVAGQPGSPKFDAAGHPLVVDDGTAAGGGVANSETPM